MKEYRITISWERWGDLSAALRYVVGEDRLDWRNEAGEVTVYMDMDGTTTDMVGDLLAMSWDELAEWYEDTGLIL